VAVALVSSATAPLTPTANASIGLVQRIKQYTVSESTLVPHLQKTTLSNVTSSPHNLRALSVLAQTSSDKLRNW
jgi:hypothetical protein